MRILLINRSNNQHHYNFKISFEKSMYVSKRRSERSLPHSDVVWRSKFKSLSTRTCSGEDMVESGAAGILLGCLTTASLYVLEVARLRTFPSHLFYYLATVVTHYLFFSHLSVYPGLPLWGAFRFSSFYTMLQGNLPRILKRLHDRYGNVVQIALAELCCVDPEASKDIYRRRLSLRLKQ